MPLELLCPPKHWDSYSHRYGFVVHRHLLSYKLEDMKSAVEIVSRFQYTANAFIFAGVGPGHLMLSRFDWTRETCILNAIAEESPDQRWPEFYTLLDFAEYLTPPRALELSA